MIKGCSSTVFFPKCHLHVAIAVVDLLQELTDIDTLHESEEGAEVLIDALRCCGLSLTAGTDCFKLGHLSCQVEYFSSVDNQSALSDCIFHIDIAFLVLFSDFSVILSYLKPSVTPVHSSSLI
ncbi:hypothetical protein XENOCAPTIV_017697 [Xenoophorus captivus]|uniref:Uncharacterized protein n=1 Tax=Xenoophorus captivus TaxID=1517983 RepID=A0ABV0R9F5_9TELE